MDMQNVYQENGFKNRVEYLKSLAEDFGVDLEHVYTIACMLGKEEDFDGLVTSLEDFVDMY